MPLSPAELAALIDRHAAPLRLWAGRATRSSEDAVQEAFCRLATLDPPPDRPAAWLYRAVRNVALAQARSEGRRRARERQASAEEAYARDPAERLFGAEAVAALAELDEALQRVLVARIWGELTLEEIAELCNISATTAFRHYRAALVQLRKKLGLPCLDTSH
ncbi:MAG: RNA polymerase sigma factor [Planctomycetaceae bacterium]